MACSDADGVDCPPPRKGAVHRADSRPRASASATNADTARWFPSRHAPAEPEWCAGRYRLRASAWPSCAGRRSHSAHHFDRAKIYYRYHPLHGVEVEVIRYLRRNSILPIVIVRCPDHSQRAIPKWMLDSLCCERCRPETKPRITLAALQQLRHLLDTQQALLSPEEHNRAESSPGDVHAEGKRLPSLATNPGFCQRPDLATASRERSRTLPGSAGPATSRSSQTRGAEKE